MAADTRATAARSMLLLPAVAFGMVIFAVPVGWLLLKSASEPQWGLQNFRALIEEPLYGRLILTTVEISLATTLICVLLGYPVAHVMATRPRLTRLLVFAVLVPFWSSVLVRTFAWMVLLQHNGLINNLLIELGIARAPLELIFNRTGVLIGMVHVLLPFLIFPVYASIKAIDRSLMPAAYCLGAPPVRAFWRVQLPLTLPGLVTGAILVFVLALGYFVTPALLGGRRDMMVAKLIQMEIGEFGNWGVAGALSVVLLVATVLLLGASQMLAGRRGAAWRF